MAITIIQPEQRLLETVYAKLLILGFPGVGKTSLLRTLDPARTLFIDIEAGDLSVKDVPILTVRPTDWPTLRDLAVRIAGPNSSHAATACYSQAHFNAVGGLLPGLDQIDTIFFDSLTEASRLCLRWCEQQPEARSERTGAKDIRGMYGLLGREVVPFVQHLQHANKNVIFVAVLEKTRDEYNLPSLDIQLEGAKSGRELPAITDEVITLDHLDFGDGKPVRGFVCTAPNPWGCPAKDRSGKLDQIEPPHLGNLKEKHHVYH